MESAHLPLPWVNIKTCFSLRAKCWLRGGEGGHFHKTYFTCSILTDQGLITETKANSLCSKVYWPVTRRESNIVIKKNYDTWATCIKSCLSSLSPITSSADLFFSIKSARLPPETEKKTIWLYIINHIKTKISLKNQWPIQLLLVLSILTLGRTRWDGCHPPKVFLIFFLNNKTSAPEDFCSCFFIPRTHVETRLVMVSYYGYEIWCHK